MGRHFAFETTSTLRRLTAGIASATIICLATGAWAQEEPPPAPPQPAADQPPPPEDPIPPAYTQTDAQAPPPPGRRGPPPPGYGPPPDPYNYGVPPGTPAGYDIDDWEEGDPIPPGYRPDTRVRKGLVIGGAVTLGALWVVSIVVAGFAVSVEEADAADGVEGSVTEEDWYPLFAPVVGPFITIGTVQTGGAGTALLIIDGVAQAGGLAMLIAGLAAQETYLRPVPQYGEVDVQFSPIVAPGFTGAGLKGTF